MDNEKLLAMAEGGPNEVLLKSLCKGSETLIRQAKDWDEAIRSPQLKNLDIFSYYETELSPTYTKINDEWKKEGLPTELVDCNSATNGRPWEKDKRHIRSISRNHTNLVRYVIDDPIYRDHVKPTLEGLLKTKQRKLRMYQLARKRSLIHEIERGLLHRTDEEEG